MKHTFDTMQIIYDIFDHKRQEKMLKDRQLYCANRIKRKFLIRATKFAPTLEDRNTNLFRYSYLSVINFLNEPSMATGKSVVLDFINSRADQHVVFDKFLNFHRKSQIIISVSA